MNFKMTVSYDGSRYNGWQRQGNTSNTIQEKIETTLSKMFGIEIEIHGAGRTDAGVHAFGQIANVKIPAKIFNSVFDGTNEKKEMESVGEIPHQKKCVEFRKTLNNYLPLDIRIRNIEVVDDRFHARLNATGKHYRYQIDQREVAGIFDRKYVSRIEEELHVDNMKKAASYLIGEHDFKTFCANKKMKKSTVRKIRDIHIENQNGLIWIDFYGDGFLYNMIRIIVGTLIEIGLGKRSPEDIKEILASKDRSKAGFLAEAKGLFLEEVYYEN